MNYYTYKLILYLIVADQLIEDREILSNQATLGSDTFHSVSSVSGFSFSSDISSEFSDDDLTRSSRKKKSKQRSIQKEEEVVDKLTDFRRHTFTNARAFESPIVETRKYR